MNSSLRPYVSISLGTLLTIILSPSNAAVLYTVNLRGVAPDPSPTPFIAFEVVPEDSNNDTWFETVIRINVGDPVLGNNFDIAEFQIAYGAPAFGVTVNIGDSRTNNGFSGDGATQSNDAEIEIGFPRNVVSQVFNDNTLGIHGNDNFPGLPPAPGEAPVLVPVIDFLGDSSEVNFVVSDQFVAWDNNAGVSGNLSSPFLYALNGQSDSEGSVNYDIFAALNRVVSSNSRIGSGVDEVTICLRRSEESSCFVSVPEPDSIAILSIALAVLISLGCGRGVGAR